MEVHHHAHTARKKWTHYFWEFLMLFLAVFCGFLAEYQLEHKIEKERGKQYLHSLYNDLQTDIEECNISISGLTEQTSVLSNMNDCFNTLLNDKKATNCLSDIIINSKGFKDFIYTDRTIQQLKNAGGLRLIQNKELADSIIAYDAIVREMHIHQLVMENLQQISKDAHNNMIDFEHLSLLLVDKKTANLYLLSENTIDLNKYFNAINQFRLSLISQLNWMKKIKTKAEGLLALLSKNGCK